MTRWSVTLPGVSPSRSVRRAVSQHRRTGQPDREVAGTATQLTSHCLVAGTVLKRSRDHRMVTGGRGVGGGGGGGGGVHQSIARNQINSQPLALTSTRGWINEEGSTAAAAAHFLLPPPPPRPTSFYPPPSHFLFTNPR